MNNCFPICALKFSFSLGVSEVVVLDYLQHWRDISTLITTTRVIHLLKPIFSVIIAVFLGFVLGFIESLFVSLVSPCS